MRSKVPDATGGRRAQITQDTHEPTLYMFICEMLEALPVWGKKMQGLLLDQLQVRLRLLRTVRHRSDNDNDRACGLIRALRFPV
jgi:hypothetical protein